MATELSFSRRRLLKWGTGAAAISLCGAFLPNFGIDEALAVELGSGDVAILNYAYALEQLEAAFYTKVTENPFAGITSAESEALGMIRDHETAHRDFFKKALGPDAIAEIDVDFAHVNFKNRASVLGTADAFENLGVAAYNGAGALLKKVDYLVAAASIVSVEARHTAIIAALLHGPSAESAGRSHVSGKGLDLEMAPNEVLKKVHPFVRTAITPIHV